MKTTLVFFVAWLARERPDDNLLPPEPMSLNSSTLRPLIYYCLDCREAFLIFNAYVCAKMLLCGPLCVLVLWLARQQSLQRSAKTTSQSDSFTCHLACMELGCIVGCLVYFCASCTDFPAVAKVALHVFSAAFPGEMCFHTLTCAERYLAVVHPIVYRGVSQSWRARIRSISVGCTLLLCCLWISVKILYKSNFPVIPFFCCLAVAVLAVSFCSFSVLSVLIHPGPGDVGGAEKRVDQLRQRAFLTVTAILAVLWLWFVGDIVCFGLSASSLLTYNNGCVVMMIGFWFCLPSSVVLPLLFLHRAGKLMCCLYSNRE